MAQINGDLPDEHLFPLLPTTEPEALEATVPQPALSLTAPPPLVPMIGIHPPSATSVGPTNFLVPLLPLQEPLPPPWRPCL